MSVGDSRSTVIRLRLLVVVPCRLENLVPPIPENGPHVEWTVLYCSYGTRTVHIQTAIYPLIFDFLHSNTLFGNMDPNDYNDSCQSI